MTLHGIHCILSGCFWPCCIKSNAFNYSAGIHCIQSCCINSPAYNRVPFLHAALNTLHSVMLHGIHGIQTGWILPGCMESTAFNHAAWIHCIQSGCILPGCMESTAFTHASWNPLHSIGMHFTMLHGLHCIQSQCMESTAFNDAAWNPLHSIGGCFGPCCIKSTAFNHAAWNPLHSIGMFWAMLH